MLLSVIVAALLAGCVAPASHINRVSIGMTKVEVLRVMGPPTSITAAPPAEFLNYSLHENPFYPSVGSPYEIKLVDGKVESFGRAGTAGIGPRPAVPVVVPIRTR